MIKNVPIIYPNESVYSWLARIYAHSGIIYYKYFSDEVFKSGDERVDYNFINLFNNDFKNIIKRTIGFKKLLLDHTLFKYYGRFISSKERQKSYELGIKNKELLPKKLHIPPTKGDYYLRYCPLCIEEDKVNFGECYFHIEHQIYDIHICPHHNTELIDTNILSGKKGFGTLQPLEQVTKIANTKIYNKDNINCLVSRFIYEVFQGPIEIRNQALISDYLSSKLSREYCVDNACTKKNVIRLTKDLLIFYKDLRNKNFKEYMVCDVYRGKKINPYDILLVAYFQGVTAKEISKLRIAKRNIRRPILRQVYNLYNAGLNASQIAQKVSRTKDKVERIIKGYLKIKKY